MRGVVSAGMLWALEDLGCHNVFDAVYGSSAGAINAAYFLAGQTGYGTSIYYEDINNRSFIDFWRALAGRPILSLDFLLSDVLGHRKRLEIGRVLESASPLSVVATDVDTGLAQVLSHFSTRHDLLDALRASATMPVIAGGPSLFRGRSYLDASISEPIALPSAEAAGHTHVLVLLTRSGQMRSQPSALDRHFVGPRLRRSSPLLADRYLRRAEPYAAILRAIDRGVGPRAGAAVAGIRVEGLTIGRLERRRHVLEAGARQGYDAVMTALPSLVRPSSPGMDTP